MAADHRSTKDVRRDIAAEREATDVAARLRAKLPLVAAGALGAGFVVAGGVGATMRFVARRGRDGRERARVGRFAVVDKS